MGKRYLKSYTKKEAIFKDDKNENLYKVKLPNSKNFSILVDILINEKIKDLCFINLKNFFLMLIPEIKEKWLVKLYN